MTPKEKKIADFFARNYDELVFENLSSISRKAEVSKPTVLRFINKLGFERFVQFHRSLRQELEMNQDTLHIRYSLKKNLLEDTKKEDIIGHTFGNTVKNLESVYGRMDRDEFAAIATAIARVQGRLYLFGQRSSHALAYLFFNMIRRVLPKTCLIPRGCTTEPDILIDVCHRDILFAVFRHPYGKEVHQLMGYFREKGAEVVLLTDSEFNPGSDLATHQLVVNTEGVSVFTSSTTILAVLESLNIAVLGAVETDVADRLETTEDLFKTFGIYCT